MKNKILKNREWNYYNFIKNETDINKYSGIDKRSFDHYFNGKNMAVAYKLGNVEVYDHPKDLVDIGINYIPQSFTYLN